MDEKIIKLWANNSNDTKDLISLFESRGFKIVHILTGASRPNTLLVSGLGNIKTFFALI
ncbi:hypothetical protein KKH36_03120 [Patescibacteria group bacterium]|nr:hypothetical protein [Patescibacteria group bacterium]